MNMLSEMFFQLSYDVFGAEKMKSLLEGLENFNDRSNISIKVINELRRSQLDCLQVGTIVPPPPSPDQSDNITINIQSKIDLGNDSDIVIIIFNPINSPPKYDDYSDDSDPKSDLTVLIEGTEVAYIL